MPLDVWDGSKWVDAKRVQVYNGTQWVDAKSVKVSDGAGGWSLAWPISTTLDVTGPTMTMSTQSGANAASPNSFVTPVFTVTVGDSSLLSKIEFQMSHAGGPWTTYKTWTDPTGSSFTHPQPFSTPGAWKYRAVGTFTVGNTIVSSEGSISCYKKTLTSELWSGSLTPPVGGTVSLLARCTDCDVGQVSSSWWYRTTGGWNSHQNGSNPLSWTNGGTTPHEWLWQEVFADGSVVNSSSTTISPVPAGVPINPPNTGIGMVFSERYSLSSTTGTITQYAPIYLAVECGAGQIVEWLYSKNGGLSYDAFPRKSRGSSSADAGYGGYAKTCIFPDTVGEWLIVCRWGPYTTAPQALQVTAGGPQWTSKMQALNSRIAAAPSLNYREYGYIAPNGANDGDTFDWQNTQDNFSTKKSLGFALGPDGNGAYLPSTYVGSVANRYLGVQAPEYSATSGKDWQWGKSAWRRNVEHVPLGTPIRMRSMYQSGAGFDSSRGDGNFRTCRAVYVPDLNVDVCDLLVEEGLAKSYTQRKNGVEGEVPRANSNLARMERASLAGIGLFRGTDPECGKWEVTFDNNYIHVKNVSAGNNRNISDWWVTDAAGVTNNQQIGSAGNSVDQGRTVDIYISGMDDAPKVETASLHTNQGDNEPDELIAWARRLEGSNADGVPMEMAISRTT